MTIFQKQKRTTLTEMALKEIRNAIQSRKLKPGDRIIEADLARQMGISRFPIREAIRCLEKERVVKTIPFEGTYVSRFDEDVLYPVACHGEPIAGFPKGRSNPLVEGGVNAPPENVSEQGGQRSPCREFTAS